VSVKPVRPNFVAPGGGESLKLRSASVRVKSSAASSGGTLTCVETSDPPGFVAPTHIHHRSSEAFYVLEGTYTFRAGDETMDCAAGAFSFIPPGTVHGYEAGDGGGRLLILYLPPGIDDMWREMQEAAIDGRLADTDRDAIGRRHGTEWVRTE
jgi:quercetin dioxygenase-like cupin family protein